MEDIAWILKSLCQNKIRPPNISRFVSTPKIFPFREVGKLYQIIPDPAAQAHGYIRVVDDSGEDYAYAADRFFVVDLPPQVEQMLLAAA